MEQNTRRSRRINLIFCLAVFAAMSVFFIVLHPIPIMDEDDVIYSVLSRKAIPIPGGWNPSRMMPELLCSLCGNLAGLCTALKLGRFISCQVAVVGLVFSLFITAYVYSLKRLLEKRFQAGSFVSVCLSVLFMLLHFLIFRSAPARNLYLFHTYDECCVFFYTLPALLCCSLIMWFMAEPDREPRFPGERLLRESMLLLILYFCRFFQSVRQCDSGGICLLPHAARIPESADGGEELSENGSGLDCRSGSVDPGGASGEHRWRAAHKTDQRGLHRGHRGRAGHGPHYGGDPRR